MSDTPANNDSRQIQLRIDESKMHSTYANTIRTSTTNDEVVLDFGMNLPVPGQDNQPALLFTEDRLAGTQLGQTRPYELF